MSIAAAALALTRELEGTPYVFQPLTFEALARFSVWCEDRGRAAMFRAAEDDGVDSKQLLAAWLDNCVAGNYEPGGEAFTRATRSDLGGRKILELMLVAPDGEKDAAKWRRTASNAIYEDEELFRKALLLAGEMNKDPKAMAARRRPLQPAVPNP